MATAVAPTLRAPRRAVSFPIDFTGDGEERVPGACENLSQSGLLAVFEAPLDIWMEGVLNLHFGTGLLGIPARVARLDGLRAGLAFLHLDTALMAKLRELMQANGVGDTLPKHL